MQTYRAKQHLHVDLGGHVDAVQLAGAVSVDDVHQGVDRGLDVRQAWGETGGGAVSGAGRAAMTAPLSCVRLGTKYGHLTEA